MIAKMPAPGLDPGVDTGFRKRSCSNEKLKPGLDSIKTAKALGPPERPLRPVARFIAGDADVGCRAMVVRHVVEKLLSLLLAPAAGPRQFRDAVEKGTP